MRICEKHWSMMRIAVEVRGMTHLIRSGEDNCETITSMLAGEVPALTSFDPLLSMHWMVSNEALRQGGLYAMGDFCPICEAMKLSANLPPVNGTDLIGPDSDFIERLWIDGPADVALNECVRRGLVSVS